MSLTTDQDVELLEAYTDGELSPPEKEALEARLAVEPQLRALLESLRGERGLRSEVWRSFEPDDSVVKQLVARVHARVDRNTNWAARLNRLRPVSAAAACILIGFLVGRVAYRGEPGTPGVPTGPMSVVQMPPSAGGVTAAGVAPPRAATQFRVVDAHNQPVTVQPFNSAEEAQQFVEDLNQWYRQMEDIRSGRNRAPTSGSF